MPRTSPMGASPSLLLVAALAVPSTPAAAQCPASEVRYSVIDLGTLGGPRRAALDLDDSGRVVGLADTLTGKLHPFLWEAGAMTDLGTLGGSDGSAGGINAWGDITGQADNASGARRAFRYSGGAMTELPTLAERDGRGFDINDAGQIVGISGVASGPQHAFLWDPTDPGVVTDLGTFDGDITSYANGINETGQIAGWSGPANDVTGARAFLYENGTRTPLGTLGGSRSVAFGLDDAGRVVGWSDVAGNATFHAFLWKDGEMSDLGTLGGERSLASGAHASGIVVGWADTLDARPHAFVHQGGALADLNALIPPGTGWELTSAVAPNGHGQVVGSGTLGGTSRAFLATPALVSVDELGDLVESFELHHGTENSLLAKLANVRQAVAGCTPAGACGSLGAFVHEVLAQSGKKITTEHAEALLAAAAALQTTLGCP